MTLQVFLSNAMIFINSIVLGQEFSTSKMYYFYVVVGRFKPFNHEGFKFIGLKDNHKWRFKLEPMELNIKRCRSKSSQVNDS